MRVRFHYESDGWTTEGRKITDLESLEAIRKVLDEEGPVVVEHWFYRGSCAPDRLVFEDFNEFREYLSRASAGDAIHVWSFATVCRNDNELAYGKCPDDDGHVPERGSY